MRLFRRARKRRPVRIDSSILKELDPLERAYELLRRAEREEREEARRAECAAANEHLERVDICTFGELPGAEFMCGHCGAHVKGAK